MLKLNTCGKGISTIEVELIASTNESKTSYSKISHFVLKLLFYNMPARKKAEMALTFLNYNYVQNYFILIFTRKFFQF